MSDMPVGQHSKSMHYNTVCKFHYRRDLMISATRCEEKIYKYIGIGIGYRPNESWNIGISDIDIKKIQYCASLPEVL